MIYGAGVTLTREGTAPQRTSTDEHGTYRFCALSPGSYQLAAVALGFETTQGSSSQNVEVKAGLFQNVDLELSLGFQEIPTNIGAVRGRVVDAKKEEALPGVLVDASVASTLTDSNGDFFLSLDIATYSLVFSKDGFHSKTLFAVTIHNDKVTALQTDVDLFPK